MASEMTSWSVWATRDGHKLSAISLWDRDPAEHWREREKSYLGYGRICYLSAKLIPDLKPGECRRVTLKLEPPNE